mmetsp:Transcript_10369/g.22280  ORF Transcript_10369/g.22280 Transcript_10369/m.22280 type:complete len:596 (+) Transcript_10369:285-2072(+)
MMGSTSTLSRSTSRCSLYSSFDLPGHLHDSYPESLNAILLSSLDIDTSFEQLGAPVPSQPGWLQPVAVSATTTSTATPILSHALRHQSSHLLRAGHANSMQAWQQASASAARGLATPHLGIPGSQGHAAASPLHANSNCLRPYTALHNQQQQRQLQEALKQRCAAQQAPAFPSLAHVAGVMPQVPSPRHSPQSAAPRHFSPPSAQAAHVQHVAQGVVRQVQQLRWSDDSGSSEPELPPGSNLVACMADLPAAMQRVTWSMDDYKLIQHVHQGYASDVYEAICNHSGKRVALKVYSLGDLDAISQVQVMREVQIHTQVSNHPHIAKLYAAFVEQLPEQSWKKDKAQAVCSPAPRMWMALTLVQEWAAGGDALRLLQRQGGRLSAALAVNLVMVPLLEAVSYLHSKAILHRDIKPENVVFDEHMQLKLLDFGLAINLREERATTRAGTLDYMAPEVLRCPTKSTPDEFKGVPGMPTYSTAADVWGLGAILYHLLVGQPPFREAQQTTTAQRIMTGSPIALPANLPLAAQHFMLACLNHKALDRPTVMQLKGHALLALHQDALVLRQVVRRNITFSGPPPSKKAVMGDMVDAAAHAHM